MKIVRILVPDTMTRILGGSGGTYPKEVAVDAEAILNALTANDYHENWYFRDPATVTVLSIEDYSE